MAGAGGASPAMKLLWGIHRVFKPPFEGSGINPGRDKFLFRVGADYFLRLAGLVAEPFDGDLMLGVTFLAVAQASVKHLNHPTQLNPLAVDGVFPDAMRRPVTIASVARALNLPRETARRYVHRLIDMGYCQQTGARGVIVPAAVMASPQVDAIVRDNLTALDLLFEALDRSAVRP
jgi:hypothetical protein